MITEDIEKAQRTHPELYSAIVAVGVNQGIQCERRRVLAHLRVAKMYHSLEEAITAVSVGMPAIFIPCENGLYYGKLHDYYADIEDARDELEFGW